MLGPVNRTSPEPLEPERCLEETVTSP